MELPASIAQWIISFILLLSSLGMIITKKPVHSCLSFLLSLLALAALYLELSASFIAVMQILVYAGAILVLFMFVIILFQDAYLKIEQVKANNSPVFLFGVGTAFVVTLFFMGKKIVDISPSGALLPKDFGTVQQLGKALYLDFFFPFEAVILLFLVALVGSLYIGKKAN